MTSLLQTDLPLRSEPESEAAFHVPIASFIACFAKSDRPGVALTSLSPAYRTIGTPDGRMTVAYRQRLIGDARREPPLPRVLVLGDDVEIDSRGPLQPMGNATVVSLSKGSLEAFTSIPGLPAIYLAESATGVVLTSDLFLLRHLTQWPLRFDPEGISDLARIGRPVAYRTLFRHVRIVPGGSRIVLTAQGRLDVHPWWRAPDHSPCADWNEYTTMQAEAFRQSVRRLKLKDCAFSLSAGIDSRTTLAGLIEHGARVRALTVSGENLCVDARTAAALCAAYGIEHRTIELDETFRGALPELAAEASLRSGGISSVWHAAQIHCYRQLGEPTPYGALSGYLGNQIGRRGTEGLTPRDTEPGFLDPALEVQPSSSAKHWYADALTADGFLDHAFLIQQESTFGTLASYAIGNTYSVQQSAYACRPLIENLWRTPTTSADTHRGSHVQNLKHLFLGEPEEESFQRRYVRRVGGMVAHYPVNWGWRPSGGVSLRGAAWGVLALTDALAASRFADSAFYKLTAAFGIAGLHEFRPVNEWLRKHMRSFIYDEVLSNTVKNAGLFDLGAVRRTLDGYFSYRGGHDFKAVVLALDLALAASTFRATA